MNIESFLYFNTVSSFKLLFVYLMSENVDWIHNNSHEEVDPHPPPKLKNCFLVVHRCKSFNCLSWAIMCSLATGSQLPNPPLMFQVNGIYFTSR
jgi:hypothetical protein